MERKKNIYEERKSGNIRYHMRHKKGKCLSGIGFLAEYMGKAVRKAGLPWKGETWGEKIFSAIVGILLLVAALHLGRTAAVYLQIGDADRQNASGGKVVVTEGRKCVVIDAGHGGDDPGKVGINGALEKDINLEIANLVKQYLEASDVTVIMTRETDEGLYDPSAPNKKVQDMKRRIALIEEYSPLVTVSIHQNSYPEEYVHGGQVFYYNNSVQGQKLAEHIQKELVEKADPENRRQVKANDSYYLLKKTGSVIVIVECGFLSNSAEAEKLCTPEYQDRVAWAIHMGILQYLNKNEK